MFKYLIAALVAVTPSAASPENRPEPPAGSVAMIQCGGRFGTAFWIGPHRILSAAHVTSGATSCRINGAIVPVVLEDGAKDIAELRSETANPAFVQVDCRGFSFGRPYRAIGFIGGQLRVNLPLIATGFYLMDGQAEFLGETQPGMSGGPVIGHHRKAVGIVNTRWPASSRPLKDTHVCRR